MGGKPDGAERNPAGDLFIMRGDKKIRFDINNYKPHNEPHFHVEMAVPKANGRSMDWAPANKNQHFYTFQKE